MILNDNSTQQINTLIIQLQNKITNLTNEFRKLNNNINDLDSEISDLERRVNSNVNDASTSAAAMNSAIKANTAAISGKADKIHTHTKSQITDFDHNHDDRYYTESEIDTKLSGKSDTGHTHTKSQIIDFPTSLKNPNALTINGKTYDGSTAVNAGVQTVANGGTGVTTQADINKAFIGDLEDGVSDVTDSTEFVSSFASDNGFSEPGYVNTPLRRKFSSVWGYIKDKISSVLGLTKDNYGGKASTAGTADEAIRLKTFASWNNPYEYDPTNGVRVNVYKITIPNAFNSILVQIYDDINYARCRRYVLGLWHVPNYGYNVSVTDLGGTKANGLKVWMGTDGNVYLQADVCWSSRISFSYLEDLYGLTISVTKIGVAKYGSNKDIDGTVLFTPLVDDIMDCGAIRADDRLSGASKEPEFLKAYCLYASSKMVIPIGAPSNLEDGCIWIER